MASGCPGPQGAGGSAGAGWAGGGHVIDNLAGSDYLLAMRSVKMAELKRRLSEYLRAIHRGMVITVLDRKAPVAWIIPFHALGLLW